MNISYILYLTKELTLIGITLIFIFIIFISIFLILFWLSKKLFPDFQSFSNIPTKKQSIFIIIVFFLMFPWLVDWTAAFKENPFLAYKIANYHYTINILGILDKIKLKDTNIAYFFRNSMFNQYINIKNSFAKDAYNAIGCFNDIDLEYARYLQNTSTNKEKYNQYKDKYIKELKNILEEYSSRNHTLYMLTTRSRNDISYTIPNRLIFYPKLALNYLHYSFSKNPNQSIEELTNILKAYDVIYKQEKDNDTYQYQLFNGAYNKYKFYLVYPSFINKYSKTIILMQNNIDKENICSQTDIFDYYLKSLEYDFIEDPIIMHIIKEDCKYF